jgi:hypothetical protein
MFWAVGGTYSSGGGGGRPISRSVSITQSRKTRTNIPALGKVFTKRATLCQGRYNFQNVMLGPIFYFIDVTCRRKSTAVSCLRPNKLCVPLCLDVKGDKYFRQFLIAIRIGCVARAQEFPCGNICHIPWDMSNMRKYLQPLCQNYVLFCSYLRLLLRNYCKTIETACLPKT